MIKIPVYQPSLSGREREYVIDCLDSTWISSKGEYIGLFENRFAELVGVRNAVAVCNGTAALHLALVALGIGPGDEVIVPTLTYIASVNAIVYTGATPVFVDSLAGTWQMDPDDIQRKLSPRTRAIMAVHLYGGACDMDAITRIANEARIFLIEDCAEAVGTTYKGKHVGGFGDIGVFSFYGNKTITTGEGGMLVTDDQTLHDRVVHFKGQGLAAYREYWHDVVGYNYRMTNIAAAIGLAQLERTEQTFTAKRELAARYVSALTGLPLSFQQETPGGRHSYWMVSVLVDRPELRDPLRQHLANSGIETRPLFYPVHTMPMYSKHYRKHAVAEDIAWRGINLPSWPTMNNDQFFSIVQEITSFFLAQAT